MSYKQTRAITIKKALCGEGEFDWVEVTTENTLYRLSLFTFAKPLRIENVQIGVSAIEFQELCDVYGCMMPTPLIVDIIHANADLVVPLIARIDGKATAYSTDVRHTEEVDKLIQSVTQRCDKQLPSVPLISSIHKTWVLTNSMLHGRYGPRQAANYGWFSPSAPSLSISKQFRLWQTIGLYHDNLHYDPSQGFRPVSMWAKLLDKQTKIEIDAHVPSLLCDKTLSHMINHDGELKLLRQPNVS